MKNKLTDLNDHLFEQIERLNDDDLTGEELNKEVTRSKAMTNVASNIISNASLMLDAAKHQTEYSSKESNVPEILRIEKR